MFWARLLLFLHVVWTQGHAPVILAPRGSGAQNNSLGVDIVDSLGEFYETLLKGGGKVKKRGNKRTLQSKESSWSKVAQAFNPSTWKAEEAGKSPSSRQTWSINQRGGDGTGL